MGPGCIGTPPTLFFGRTMFCPPWTFSRRLLTQVIVSDTSPMAFACLGSRLQPALAHRLLEALPATNGYAQSKTLSELLVRDCASRTHYMSIIIPAYIIGDADAGVANLNDFLWRYVWACVQLGFFNGSDRAKWLFVGGRQGIARQILDITLHGPPSGRFLAVDDGITVAEFWCAIMETLQRELQPLPQDGSMPLPASVGQCGEKHPTWPVRCTF
ncbi:hypothetical protein HFD88_002334 [Aspergillus terreus]|nr:hypothetical protein HFD88_002334 [Aspergillus terreus]